jgi:alkanesulfonate monooxygenase SsuD/methylene tetrahydromethanopterin reductase-like flavin-dependent oxidoreductase (luciferase family)
VSLRLYPHLDRAAPAVVDELLAQGVLAAGHGFDGVMTSEHHGGFAGYLPNPLQAAGWLLDAMPTGWAAPCPLLLPLRSAALVAEEVAWLAARFPGRVALGVAAGALADDFEIAGTGMDDLTARFAAGLETVASLLRGEALGRLAGDPALAARAADPVPVVSAASSVTAVRRAARLGAGILLDSLTTVERCRELTDAYLDAGGGGPRVLIRRAWVGEPHRAETEAQVEVYRGYASPGAQSHWGAQEQVAAGPEAVAEALDAALRAAGCDCLNVRVHVPGVPPEAVRDQIAALADDVLPRLRARAVRR